MSLTHEPDTGIVGPLPLPSDIGQALESAGPRISPLGDHVHYFGTVGSTNDIAARLAAAGAATGTTVLAEAQSAGRGRLGRVWHSPPDAGLYVSIVFRPERQTASAPELSTRLAARYTLMAGVALAEAIRTCTGLPIEIKWPNDLVIQTAHLQTRRLRKVAGILTEAMVTGSRLDHVVVGFGINVRAAALPRDITATATSLEAELDRPVDRALLLVEALAELVVWSPRGRDRFPDVVRRWRELAPSSVGSLVRWRHDGVDRTAVTAGIDDDGALLARVGGHLERLIAGEVTWL